MPEPVQGMTSARAVLPSPRCARVRCWRRAPGGGVLTVVRPVARRCPAAIGTIVAHELVHPLASCGDGILWRRRAHGAVVPDAAGDAPASVPRDLSRIVYFYLGSIVECGRGCYRSVDRPDRQSVRAWGRHAAAAARRPRRADLCLRHRHRPGRSRELVPADRTVGPARRRQDGPPSRLSRPRPRRRVADRAVRGAAGRRPAGPGRRGPAADDPHGQ